MHKISKFGSNCCPVAVKILSGKDDDAVVHTCANHGFTPKSGMHVRGVLASLKLLGVEFVAEAHYMNLATDLRKSVTAHKFAKQFPNKTFIAFNKTHGYIIHNGRVIDWNFRNVSRKKLRVGLAYEITSYDEKSVSHYADQIKEVQEKKHRKMPISSFYGRKIGLKVGTSDELCKHMRYEMRMNTYKFINLWNKNRHEFTVKDYIDNGVKIATIAYVINKDRAFFIEGN